MNRDRQKKLESLVDAARQQPASDQARFLDDACGSDQELRREVESLLASDRVERQAVGTAGLSAGTTLGHYQIVELLGRGGMGEVFRARDTKLGRDVAIKILPPEVSDSRERRSRFEREAKAVAALNHPNIVVVYSVEQEEGLSFITLELVPGKTLSELLPEKGMPLDRFFTIAVPLAEAVAAAHQAGITHRDLKPDNVMVTDDGRVKVLDFGLAKPSQPLSSGAGTLTKTREGRVLGTPAYMSPEQAEGKPVDHRSDLFSLGIILYEMLTGRRPFSGDTPPAVVSSILKDAALPIAELRPEVPPELASVVELALEKDPERRPATASFLLEGLRQARRPDAEPGPRPRRSALVGSGVIVLVLAATAIVALLRPRADDAPPRLANPVQVTSVIGVEDYPTWSPDGRSLAYHSNQSGNWDIWVSQIDGGQPLNRTAGHPGADQYPSWSPDTTQIAFFSDRGGGGIFVMPVLAGPARRISLPGTIARGRPQWSSDGTELAYEILEDNASFAEITTVASGDSRRVSLPAERNKRLDLSWSPSGRFFAFVDADEPSNTANALWVLDVEDGTSVRITEIQSREMSPSWSEDETALYFTSDRGGTLDVWRQRLDAEGRPAGEADALTAGLEVQASVLSPDGSKIAYGKGGQVSNVWRVPIRSDGPATWTDAEPLTHDEASVFFMDVSPDHTQLAFDSDRSGSTDIWILDLQSRQIRQLTTDEGIEASPSWSPDGREVAFYSNRAGTRDIWAKPVDGGPARQVTDHASEDYWPSWSPDGRSILFGSTRGGLGTTIWTIPSEGGTATRLTPLSDVNAPRWSPDGQWLLFGSYGAHIAPKTWLLARGAVEAERITDGDSRPRWSPDGRQIVFKRDPTGRRSSGINRADLWAIDHESRSETRLTDLSGRNGGLGSFTTDGSYLYFAWLEQTGELWVMDVLAPER